MQNQFFEDDVRRAKSLLSPAQRGWLTVALAFAALLLANTVYLLINRLASSVLPGGTAERVAEGTYTISKLFQVMVLSHTGMGILVVAMLAIFAVWHLPKVWRRHRRRTVATGLIFVGSGLVLAVTGPFIMYAAASRDHAWIWWTHVAAAAVVPAAYILHRVLSFVPPRTAVLTQYGTLVGGLVIGILTAHAIGQRGSTLTPEARLAQQAGSYTGPGSKMRTVADSVEGLYVPVGFVPPASPFFPSAATTTTGDYLPERIITRGDVSTPEKLAHDLDTIGFVVNEKIGAETCERCHMDIVEQWSKSAHRFASFNNPFYEASINDMRKNALSPTDGVSKHSGHFPQWADRTGKIKSKWCSGCHDPSVMLAGQMTEEIDRRSPQAQAGLTCLACHAIDQIHNQTGNGNYNIADEHEDPYLFPDAQTGSWEALVHDTAIKAKPEAHKKQMLQPIFRTSEFCATCHKVSLPQAVNDYRWFRGQNEYDNWHDSGVAHNAARTFYLPPAKRVCQDCHMPPEEAVLGDFAAKNGKVRSHRFLAVNTALPFVRGDSETIARIEKFLREDRLRIDVFALVRGSESDSRQTTFALDKARPTLLAGEKVTFDVVVRNKDVGHTFPGGTNDSNEGWIEFTLLDAQDRVIAQSGSVGDDGYVDSAAHYFRGLVVDRHSEPIRRRNAQDMYAPVYMNVIGPGTAHTIHYAMEIPDDLAGQELKVRARLMWRKFDRGYTEFAFNTNRDAFKRFDKTPDLPITEIAKTEVTLAVTSQAATGTAAAPSEELLASDWMRYNDYAIGLLLQNDTKGALAAFAEVERIAPKRIDGPRNLARVALQDGDLEAAYKHLLRCEELVSNDPQTAWWWGVLLQEDGRYVEAASAYKRVLQKFPEDRATWRNLGRTYYLDGKFEDAIASFDEVLAIDPEDRIAHYHVMLAARSLGRTEQAARAEEAYLRYKIDESAAEVTQAYRLEHHHDNLESQMIHVHELTSRAPVVKVTEAAGVGHGE